MTARDRYTIPLKCPKCGAVGVAHVSENDGWSAVHEPGFSVQSVSPGFKVMKAGRTSVEPDFGCVACGEVAG